jgi:2-phospho-L-lactate guanylyltransferase
VARVGDGAKSRLSAVLEPAERTWLARAMLADVLGVCLDSADILAGTVAVVDQQARDVAARYATTLLDDPVRGDMNAAVRAGVSAAQARGATSVLVLPGDIPSISVADVRDMLGVAGTAPRAVVVAASRDGQGTNALLLRPPHVIAPSFGPPSVRRHLQAGYAAGARTRLIEHLGLARDVDTPPDLTSLLDARVGEHTTAALARLTPGRGPAFI